MSTMSVAITEQKLLEQAAKRAGFDYLMYVPESWPHPSGLLYSRPNARVRVWNPCDNDGDLLYLAAAVPNVDLQRIITDASQLDGDPATRLEYVRRTFVRAVVDQGTAAEQTAANPAPAAAPAGPVSEMASQPQAPATWWQRLTTTSWWQRVTSFSR